MDKTFEPDCEHPNEGRSNDQTSSGVVEVLVGAVVAALLAGGAYLVIKKLWELRDKIDWGGLVKMFFETLDAEMTVGKLHPLLDEAEDLIERDEEFTPFWAASSISVALEKSLKILATRSDIDWDDSEEKRGAVPLATLLEQEGVIEERETNQIKHIIRTIRNPAFHGKLHGFSRSQLESALQWVRGFVSGHLEYPPNS